MSKPLFFLVAGPNAGFRTILIYIALETAALSAQRVQDRVTKGGHDVPAVDIRRRHPRSLKNLQHYIQAFDIAHIYDNSATRQWVAGYRDGLLNKRAHSVPPWLGHLLCL